VLPLARAAVLRMAADRAGAGLLTYHAWRTITTLIMHDRANPEKSVSDHAEPGMTGAQILARDVLAIGQDLAEHLTDPEWILSHRLAIQPLLESVYEKRKRALANVLILVDLVTMVDGLRDRLDAALREYCGAPYLPIEASPTAPAGRSSGVER